ncbi:hypothetical protein LEP1GSC079_0010 [Leptospira interrogans str. FPW1039]|uniref:Uncharacterized protein n=2 Tax=Leptospira interrogans TaxID=173 RepID=A0A0F6I7D7_LEPIR|nr:hypothetical protein [Leptospira interrogans]EMJ33962.1 hypothetical protein LEP1GSC079_0010 [Leptospira interrogans str. FPW1039]EMN35452.1 hypothetical protein LEP1GSC084_0070 [Leptospira interrogans serovar Medanensis str. L0448]EMN38435.1 hypothetical protein LEP1GSC085_3395 [Leptospira interrogans str. L0996]
MIISKKLEIQVRELEKKGYSFIYIEDYVKGYFESKIKIARNMFKEGFELNVVLRITGFTEQELKDYGSAFRNLFKRLKTIEDSIDFLQRYET